MEKLINKLLLALILNPLFIICVCNAQWVQTNGPSGGRIYAFAYHNSTIYSAATGGISLSTNSGLNWQETSLFKFTNSVGYNNNTLFAGISNEGVKISTNNGTNWSNTELNSQNIYCYAFSGSYCFAGSWNSLGVFRSTNNGNNWIQTSLNKSVSALNYLNANLYAGTYLEGVYMSSDYGNNWIQTSLNSTSIYSLTSSGTNIYAGTGTNGVYYSSNNGANWISIGLNGMTVSALSVYGSNIFAGTWSNGIYYSTNNGANWISTSINNRTVYSLYHNGTYLMAAVEYLGVMVSSNNGAEWTQGNIKKTASYSVINGASKLFSGGLSGIYWTSNNGSEWISTQVIDGVNCVSVSGTIVCGASGTKGVCISTNGGNYWINSSVSNRYVKTVACNSTFIFAGTSDSGVFRSSNTEFSWSKIGGGTSNNALIICGSYLYSGNAGYPAPSVASFYASTNNGSNWIYPNFVNKTVKCLWATGAEVYAGISDEGLYKSTNNGQNFVLTNLTVPNITAITSNGNVIIAGTQTQGVYLSTNGGTTWIQKNEGFPNVDLNILSINISNNYVFAGVSNYSVWKRDYNEIISGFLNTGIEMPESYSLHQNYPNPFNQTSIFKFQCSMKGHVNVSVYDIAGREVRTLVNETLQPGTYEVRFDGSGLNSGVYFVRMTAGEFTETRKMVLLK
ncbi:MAG: T9SS type A sorting domain-containing protein [Ignavibacteria bacterium]